MSHPSLGTMPPSWAPICKASMRSPNTRELSATRTTGSGRRRRLQQGLVVTQIAVSVILNGLKKVKRIRGREIGGDTLPEVRIRARQAEPDLKVRLRRAIDRLPEGYRTVFVLHDVEGYTHEEIASALGIQSGTSKAQLSRARARLRTELAEFAGEWAS